MANITLDRRDFAFAPNATLGNGRIRGVPATHGMVTVADQ